MPPLHRSRTSWWIPRPSTLFTAMVAGYSIGVMVSFENYAGMSPVAWGWPFIYRVIPRGAAGGPSFDAFALAADIAIAAGLFASACFTTQIIACRLVPSGRLTIRSACLWIVAFGLYLGLWRTGLRARAFAQLVGFLCCLASPYLLFVIWIGSQDEAPREGS